MHQYDLTHFKWGVIELLLPNKPRGMPRADDRRVLNGIFLGAAVRGALARRPGALRPPHDLLQWLRAVTQGSAWDRLMSALGHPLAEAPILSEAVPLDRRFENGSIPVRMLQPTLRRPLI